MNNTRLFLVSGLVVICSLLSALFLASSFARHVKAQTANSAESLPAPTNELPPPQNFLPGVSQTSQPAAGEAVPAQNQQSVEGAPGLSDVANPVDDELKTQNFEGYTYDPSGRRDPFMPPASLFHDEEARLPVVPQDQSPSVEPELIVNPDPLLAYYVKDYKLIGILWDVATPRAMIKGPSGSVQTVRLRTRLGREGGIIAAIREREVIVVLPDQKGGYAKGEAVRIRMKN